MTVDVSKPDRRKVAQAIKKAEKNTSGEIVVVLTAQSDDYIHVPLHIAAAVALGLPLLIPLLELFFPWAAVPTLWVFLLQIALFIIVALVLSLAPMRYLVTPKSLMRKYAHRLAAAQFLAVRAHGTGGRTGVLIFVSLLEHYCEILADTAIAAKVSKQDWQRIIDDMLPLLRREQIAEALVLGVEGCGEKLAEHFPPGSDNPNELPDHLIIVDGAGD